MRNKQVEFNPYIYTLLKFSRFGYQVSIFKYTTGPYSEQPPEQQAHTSRLSLVGKMDVKIFLMFIVVENKNKIGTKSCNSRHFRWVIVAQKEDRLSILRRIEFLIGKNYETYIGFL